ncbi:MAG TPA: hypothetical protein VMR96_08425 [Solirubrobacterales bacterium]|nr:hypothetical protein [Solirubrobacterales bacterium]
MLGRRRIDTPAPFRSSIANAAFAVEERVVWGGADVLSRIAEMIKWPFERVIWAIERGFVWPLEERTDGWSAPVRMLGVVALVLLAAGAGVLGLVWASGSGGGGTSSVQQAAAPAPAPIVRQVPSPAPAAAAPVLQGAKPDFAAEPETGVAKSAGEIASSDSAAATSGSTAEVAKSASSANGSAAGAAAAKPAGPAATKVARQFAGAFVLFETGRKTPAVRTTFNETATPQLTRELLQRPPRLPAGVEVPKAKVLNVVAGPQRGGTYTLSVSLLRVGVTSELRLDMQLDPKTSEWRVTDVRG